MSEKFWRPTGRLADAISLYQALAGWSALWVAVAGAMSGVASQVEWIWAQGWAMTFIAGLGLTLAFSLILFLGGMALAAYRYFRPLPPPSGMPAPLPASSPSAGVGALSERLDSMAAESRQRADAFRAALVELQGKVAGLEQTITGRMGPGLAATDAKLGDLATRLEKADRGLFDRTEAIKDYLTSTNAEMRQAIADVARDARSSVDGVIAGVGVQVREIEGRLGEMEARATAIQDHLHRLLRVRDAARRLRPLFEELRPLAERLLLADRGDYPSGEAWRADYEAWSGKLGEFWRLARQWDRPGVDPLALSADDLDRVKVGCEDERFADFELPRRRRVLVAAHLKHGQYAGEALARIEAEAYGEPNPA